MYLTHRPTTLQDLDTCLPLIDNGFAFPSESRPALLSLWRHLIAGRMAESAVIEDHERQAGRRIIAFGLSVFVSDEFAEELVTSLPPYQTVHVLERWRQGRPPFLTADEIGRANADAGVNVLALHRGCPMLVEAPQSVPEIGYKFLEAFMAHHSGYRLKRFQQEVYGDERLDLEALGCHVETDYAEFFDRGFPPPPPGRHPYAIGMTSATALARHSYFHTLFTTPKPRFGFKLREQDVLTHALAGRTDEEIAQRQYLSLWTIKKRWQTIYERVVAIEPEILSRGEADEPGAQGQQRRRLLHYLRLHPEELRPYASSTKKGTGAPPA